MMLEQRGDELWAEFDDPDRGQRAAGIRRRRSGPAISASHKAPGGDDHRIA